MSTIYRKTALGLDEMETRSRRLSPRLRAALIMIDGKREDDELRKIITQHADETLQALIEMGLIEAVAVLPPRPAVSPAQAISFEALRRSAVHDLNESLGPEGESLALKMERASDLRQLRPLLETAVTVIGNARGGGAAAKFALKFIEPVA
jgi:hypothetical protein